MCGCLLSTLYWGPGLQCRHVPWLGIEPMTLWFEGQHSIHWATPARAKWQYMFLYDSSCNWELLLFCFQGTVHFPGYHTLLKVEKGLRCIYKPSPTYSFRAQTIPKFHVSVLSKVREIFLAPFRGKGLGGGEMAQSIFRTRWWKASELIRSCRRAWDPSVITAQWTWRIECLIWL